MDSVFQNGVCMILTFLKILCFSKMKNQYLDYALAHPIVLSG